MMERQVAGEEWSVASEEGSDDGIGDEAGPPDADEEA